MSLDEFLALNPQHNRPVIAGADEQTILLPIDNAEIFAAKLELDRPAAGVVAGVPAEAQRDAAAGRGPLRRCRWKRCARSTASGRARACPPATRCWCRRRAAVDGGGGVAGPGGVHDGARRPHVLLHGRGAATRWRRGRALRRHRPQDLKRWNDLTQGQRAQPGQKLRVTSDVVADAEGGRPASKRAWPRRVRASRRNRSGKTPAPPQAAAARHQGRAGGRQAAAHRARRTPTPAAERGSGRHRAGGVSDCANENGRRVMASPVFVRRKLATDVLPKALTASWRPSSSRPCA